MEMRSTYVVGVAVILFVGILGWTSCTTTRSESDLSQYKIAYNVYYDTAEGNYEVFVMNADGTEKKNISNSKGIDWVYYAYKDKLYFASDRDTTYRMYFLYEMDADGNNIRKVSDLRLEDSFLSSRKAVKELVVSGRIGKEIRQQLFLIDVQAGSYKQITFDTASSFSDPCFDANGEQIIFRHRLNRRNFQLEKAELWIMNADGTGKRQLTHYPEADTTAPWHSYHAGPPQVIPGTDRISYISFQNNNYSIFSTSPDGTEVTQLTPDEINEGWHSWSPDGKWLAFDASDSSSSWFDIWLMNADGTDLKKLAVDWRFEQGPVFVESPRK
jgi:TolB protein